LFRLLKRLLWLLWGLPLQWLLGLGRLLWLL
jgi:hypothetical protein